MFRCVGKMSRIPYLYFAVIYLLLSVACLHGILKGHKGSRLALGLPTEEYFFKSTQLSLHNPPAPSKLVSNVTDIEDFVQLLKTPRKVCKKLVILGGRSCGGLLDGNKIVCADILPSDLRSCLVYSYGVHYDISFDREAARLGCNVHMFDISKFGHSVGGRLAFHRSGVNGVPAKVFFRKQNLSLEMDTVGGHMWHLGHLGRALHALKLDVEGTEWVVLKELVASPLLDFVGQIVVELHLDDLVDHPPEKMARVLQDRLSILESLSKRGFVLAWYQDNPKSRTTRPPPRGTGVHTCGEALFLNAAWVPLGPPHPSRSSEEHLILHYQSQPRPRLVEGILEGDLPSEP